jgi:hypothetical protein
MTMSTPNPLTPPAVKTKVEGTPTPAAVKPPKAPKEPKAAKEKTVKRSAFQALYPEDAALTLLVTENPKKQGSKARERFEHYFTSKTVGDFLAKGGGYGDIAYDLGRGRIKIG